MQPGPDRITIRQAGADAFDVDVAFCGALAPARAEAAARGLSERGVRAVRRPQGEGWSVAFGPLSPARMVLCCPGVIW